MRKRIQQSGILQEISSQMKCFPKTKVSRVCLITSFGKAERVTVVSKYSRKAGADMLEKQVEQKLVAAVKSKGGVCWKFTSPGTAGVPDRIDIDCAAATGSEFGRVGILRLDDGAEFYATINPGE